MSAGEHRPEILFASIAAGGGHVAVARVMADAIEHHYPGRFELRISDYMKEVGAKRVADLDRLHKDTWRFMLRYPILARTSQRAMDAFPLLTIAAQRRLVRGFARAAAADLREDPPLLIFSNHGLMTAGLAEAKRIGGLEVPVLSFANELVGICYPVRQAFLNAPTKPEARARLGLEDRFTCLVSSGGEGVGRNQRELVRALLGSEVPLQVVVVAGRNERLKEELRALVAGKNLLRIEGYVEDMATYLAASDVFVGKAGPASVYEAIVVCRPALVTGYAGLNEVGVARLVEERGLGHYVRNPKELLKEVRRYAFEPALLEEVARRCRALDPVAATERLARYVVRYAELGKDAA